MIFAPEDLTLDGFLDGRVRLWQPSRGYRAAIDPVLLAAFVPAVSGERVLELGCGAGTAALCLAARVPGLELHGIEVQPAYADLARRNATANGADFSVHDGDLRQPPAPLRALTFDHVFANPPFHAAATVGAADLGRDLAHRESDTLPGDWVDAGLRRLRPGGRLSLIHQPDRLGEILSALAGRAGAIHILPVAPRADAAANRILLRARKGKGGETRLWPALTLHTGHTHADNGSGYSPAADSVLRGMRNLLPDTR